MDDRYDTASTDSSTSTAELDPAAVSITVTLDDLGALRAMIRTAALTAGISADEVDRLLVAVTEIVNNAIEHGGGTASVIMQNRADGVFVEIRDTGPGLPADWNIERPPPEALRGRGLWIATAMCPDLDIINSTAGLTVRIFFPRPGVEV